jgi:hypothetical protein
MIGGLGSIGCHLPVDLIDGTDARLTTRRPKPLLFFNIDHTKHFSIYGATVPIRPFAQSSSDIVRVSPDEPKGAASETCYAGSPTSRRSRAARPSADLDLESSRTSRSENIPWAI